MTESSLEAFLAQTFDGVSRLVVRHVRTQSFRWWGLVELLLCLLLCFCMIPLLIVMVVLGEGDGDLFLDAPTPDRLHHDWHEIEFLAIGPGDQVLGRVQQRIVQQQDGHRLLSAILAAADRQGLIVVESLRAQSSEVLHTWYGGRPLLASPILPDSEQLAGRLEQAGCTIGRGEDFVRVICPAPGGNRLVLAIKSLALLLPAAILPSARRAVRTGFAELSGSGPPAWILEVRADRITAGWRQGGQDFDRMELDAARLIGCAYSRVLGYGNDADVSGPHLRIATTQGFAELQPPAKLGRLLCDWLTRESLELRTARPDLVRSELAFGSTRCPHCGTPCELQENACPHCGGSAKDLS